MIGKQHNCPRCGTTHPVGDHLEEVDMHNIYKTEEREQRELREATEAYRQVKRDRELVLGTSFGIYVVASLLLFFGSGSMITVGATGLALSLTLFFISELYLKGQLGRRQFEMDLAIATYYRKKSLPFYYELLEKFGDDPHIKVRLSDNGMIQLKDTRERSTDGEVER